MPLKKLEPGKKYRWGLEEIRTGLEHFRSLHGHYPTATEVDDFPFLPPVRTIQRRFGGLVSLRKKFNLDAQSDYRNGKHSTARAYMINKRAHEVEAVVYKFLTDRFGKEFVHREYFFATDRRTRADFFVYDRDNGFCVDVFYPSDRRNVLGCLNNKLHKYKENQITGNLVIYLQMNHDISQEVLDEIARNKKNVLPREHYLMSWASFQSFCRERAPLAVR